MAPSPAPLSGQPSDAAQQAERKHHELNGMERAPQGAKAGEHPVGQSHNNGLATYNVAGPSTQPHAAQKNEMNGSASSKLSHSMPPPSTSSRHGSPNGPSTPLSLKAQGKAKAVDDRDASAQKALPDGNHHLSHSRLFSSPSPPPTGNAPNHVTLADLAAELNYEGDGLIPLGAIVERVATEAYNEIHNLGETMSSLSSSSRRTRVFNTALELRKQMIKLYVLTKWSRSAAHLQHIKDIIGLVHEQSYQTVDAREHLAETRGILPNARERNHDLITAIDVLSTGEPRKIPKSIEADAIPPPPLTDAEALEIVHELDEALRVRLTCYETLPLQLQTGCRVEDGRVRMTAPHLFEIALTLSGAGRDDRWYLLDVVFDYNVTGSGSDRFPKALRDEQREGFISTANEVLAPMGAGLPITDGIDDAGRMDVDQADEGETKQDHRQNEQQSAASSCDRPIVRLFNFLQSQALEYQLDILAYQVAEASRLRWRGDLEWSWEGRMLCIRYWRRGANQTDGEGSSRQGQWNPLKAGTLKLQVKPRKDRNVSDDLWRQLSRGENDNEQEDAPVAESATRDEDGNREQRLELLQDLDIDQRLLSDQTGAGGASRVDRPQRVAAQDLDAEVLLRRVLSAHAELAMHVFGKRIGSSSLGQSMGGSDAYSEVQTGTEGSELIVALHSTLSVCLCIEAKTGRFSLRPVTTLGRKTVQVKQEGGSTSLAASALSESTSNARFREAADSINAKPSSLVDVLSNLRIASLREQLEQSAAYLGLPTLRRLELTQEEHGKLGVSKPSHLLYLPLEQCPTFYLAFVIREPASRNAPIISYYNADVALISTLPATYGNGANNAVVISTLQWFDVPRLLVSHGKGKLDIHMAPASFSTDDVARLHSYAVALTTSSQLQSQMRLQGINFNTVPARSARRGLRSSRLRARRRAEDAVPSLTVHSTDLFGPASSSLLRNNVLISVKKYWNPAKCYVQALARLNFSVAGNKSGNDGRSSRISIPGSVASISCDLQTGTLSFKTQNLAQAWELFAFEWHSIAKITFLASRLSSPRVKEPKSVASTLAVAPRLFHFDLRSVGFTYGGTEHDLVAHVRWDSGDSTSLNALQALVAGQQTAPGYRVDFSCRGKAGQEAASEEANPHTMIKQSLQTMLDASLKTSGGSSVAVTPNWSGFLILLQDTLPILRALMPLRSRAMEDASEPDVEVLSATWYRVIFVERYRLDVRLLKGRRVVVQDSYGVVPELEDDTGSGAEEKQASALLPRIEGLHEMLNDALGKLTSDTKTTGGASARSSAVVGGNAVVCDLTEEGGAVAQRLLTEVVDIVGKRLAEAAGLIETS